MNVLLVAPQPFFQERGTPMAVDLLVRTLAEQGHQVDLLTFFEGEDRRYEGVNHYRLHPWFGINQIRPGFSVKKLVLDFFLFWKFFSMMFKKRYDVVHAVEESVFMAFVICPIRGVKYIYDMDSSMATQIADKLPKQLMIVEPLLSFFESLPMRFATVVIPVCDSLADIVHRYRKEGVFILKDISMTDKETKYTDVVDISATIIDGSKVLMYIGNLESYQGIDLMLEAFSIACESAASEKKSLAIIGGEPEQIEYFKQQCSRLNISDNTYFFGMQPVRHLFSLMRQADVMVSPRIHGVNTPMKVYSYMDSGVVTLATRLPTHTQVMTDDTAFLVDATPGAMGEGINTILQDNEARKRLSENAIAYIEKEHSVSGFKKRLAYIYDCL